MSAPTKSETELLTQLRALLRKALELSEDNPAASSHLDGPMRHVEIAVRLIQRAVGESSPEHLPTRGIGSIVSRLMHGLSTEPRTKEARDQEARTHRSVPLTGSSENVPLPDLISFLQSQGKSGVLKVVGEEEIFTIEIENGVLIHASSDNSPAQCRLGEVLVRQGFIDEKRLTRFFEKYNGRRQQLGEALLQDELVSEEHLETALELQVQQLFHRLFDTASAYFYFVEGRAEVRDLSIRMNVTQLLMESARVQDEVRGLRQAMNP